MKLSQTIDNTNEPYAGLEPSLWHRLQVTHRTGQFSLIRKTYFASNPLLLLCVAFSLDTVYPRVCDHLNIIFNCELNIVTPWTRVCCLNRPTLVPKASYKPFKPTAGNLTSNVWLWFIAPHSSLTLKHHWSSWKGFTSAYFSTFK